MAGNTLEIALKILKFGTAAAGAAFILAAMVPTFIATYKSKQTSGLNVSMFLLHACVALLFTSSSIIFLKLSISANGVDGILTCAILGFLNFVCCAGNGYVFFLKRKNMAAANRAGITEDEYCARLTAQMEREAEE